MPGNSATAAHCAAIRDDFGLTMPVLVDWNQQVSAALGLSGHNAWSVAVEPGMKLAAKQKYGTGQVFGAINALLTP